MRGDSIGASLHLERALDMVLELGDSGRDVLPDVLFAYTQRLPSDASARAVLKRVEPLPLIKSLRAGETLSVDESIQLHTALGRLEQASGNLDAARKDLDEALRLRTKHDEPGSPWLEQLQGMKAELEIQAGDAAKARTALTQAEQSQAHNPAKLPYFTKPLADLRLRLASAPN